MSTTIGRRPATWCWRAAVATALLVAISGSGQVDGAQPQPDPARATDAVCGPLPMIDADCRIVIICRQIVGAERPVRWQPTEVFRHPTPTPLDGCDRLVVPGVPPWRPPDDARARCPMPAVPRKPPPIIWSGRDAPIHRPHHRQETR